MTRAICVGVGAALLLAPLIAGTPEDSVGFLSCAIISFMCAGLLGMGAWLGLSIWRGQTKFLLGTGAKRVALSFGLLLIWALLSLVGRVIPQHSPAYLGVLLHGFEILSADFAIFLLAHFAARSGRKAFYTLLLIAVVASAIVAALGVQQYLVNLKQGGDPNARVFSTSTPDFLAGYLVLVLPVTFALFLGASAKSRLSWLYGLVVILQLATTWVSGSRFALVSLVAALAVFGLALWRATRQGMAVPDTLKRRLLGIGIVIALAGIVAARPLIHRLQHPEANSAAFRVWTWRGTVQMAQANPLLGTGIGTYLDLYPRYALTGFTRLAHNSYLQMAAECGFPGLLLLLGLLGLTLAAAWDRLKSAESNPKEPSSWLTTVALPDDRLLVCGLVAGLAAGIVQNLIDSDWYVFFLGLIFWAIAGLAVGIGSPPAPNNRGTGVRNGSPIIGGGGGLFCAFLALLTLTQGIAALLGAQAQAKLADPPAAEAEYQNALQWDALNSRYPGELGYKVYYREQKNLTAAESFLRQAIAKEPTGVLYRRLGRVLEEQKRPQDAYNAYQSGLSCDPNALDLLLAAASVGTPEQTLSAYQKIATLETSPVGTVRAIGEITEVKFAIADAALADDAAVRPDAQTATRYYERAARVLEAYANEDGSLNAERAASTGGLPDPDTDAAMQALYARVMKGWQSVSPAQTTELEARATPILQKYAEVLAKSRKPGNI